MSFRIITAENAEFAEPLNKFFSALFADSAVDKKQA